MYPLRSLLAGALAGALALPASTAIRAESAAPAALSEVRITEISASVLLDLPQGYVIEPGGDVTAVVYKLGPDPANPTRVFSGGKVKLDRTGDKAAPGAFTASFSGSGFVLSPSDKIRVQLTGPLLSKTRDETATLEAVTRDIPLKGADLGRLFIEKEPTRGIVRPTAAATATPAAGTAPAVAAVPPPGVGLRMIVKGAGELKLFEKGQLQIRFLDGNAAGSGKELPELGKVSVQLNRATDLGGFYARVSLPSLTLKPGQKFIIEAKAPLELDDKDKRKKENKTVLAEGRTPVMTVGRGGSSDLGMVRMTLRD